MSDSEMLAGISPELLARYDVAGPRYTSYPAVPDWNKAPDAAGWAAHLAALGAPDTSIALYVHLPFCASQCLYCGCNATVTTRAEIVDRYLVRLRIELDMLSRAMGGRPRVSEMHWGGGTPNFLNDAQLATLHDVLLSTFEIGTHTESSLEADPRLVTRSQLRLLRQLGFTRVSFGVQDLDAVVQQAIGRVQPRAMVQDAVTLAREEGFTGINFDLIYGLPHQTPERFAATVSDSLAMHPDRIACFGYAHVPWMRAHQRRIDMQSLPGATARFSLFRDAVQRFVGAGYEWIGIDHFARPDDALTQAMRSGALHRNFMGYTTQHSPHLLGVGVSAISSVNGWFVQNAPRLGEWQRRLEAGVLPVIGGHILTSDDQVRGAAIAHLMCHAALPATRYPDDKATMQALYSPFVDDGLVTFEDSGLRATAQGRWLLRNLAFPLDAYRARRHTAPITAIAKDDLSHAPEIVAPRFSRAV